MTKPIDDIALRYALRLNIIIRDMRRELTDEAFLETVKFVLWRNGYHVIADSLYPLPDPRRPLRLELKQRQEQK